MKIMYLTSAGINLGFRGKPLGVPVEGPSKGLPEICIVISILSKAVRHLYIYSSVITCKGVDLLIIDVLVIQ